MKVLHVSFSDGLGGADIAALRLHQAQIKSGIDSQLLVVEKITNMPSVMDISKFLKFYIKAVNFLLRKVLVLTERKNDSLLSLNIFPTGLHKKINSYEADIVNLHWVNCSMISINEISKIKTKVVWTLHDMWPFNGIEHYVNLTAEKKNMFSYFNLLALKQKRKLYQNKEVHFVCPSYWIEEELGRSSFGGVIASKSVIPNILDQSIFKPLNKNFCRDVLGIPIDSKVILFGAASALTDPRKGFLDLCAAIGKLLDDGVNISVAIFGNNEGAQKLSEMGINVYSFGYVKDLYALSVLYNASDVFVAPSLQDNLPNTILEAVFCNVRCVAFDVGGVGDLLQHGLCSLVPAQDTVLLADAILNQLNHKDSYLETVNPIISRSSSAVSTYRSLYESLL